MRLTLPLMLILAAASPAAVADEKPQAKPVAKPAAKPAEAPQPAAPASPAPAAAQSEDDEKIIYAIGLSVWRSLGQLDLSPAELQVVQRALSDAAAGKPALKLEDYGPKFEVFARGRAQRAAEKEKARSQAYLDKQATEPGAAKSESGLIYFETHAGAGASPAASDTVKVHYKGTLVDGSEFDSSYKRGEPAQFPLSGVIRCWTEGLQKMKVGGKARLVCPAAIAYGERGRPGIPGNAALTFEVELLEIVAPPSPPPAPAPSPDPAPKQ